MEPASTNRIAMLDHFRELAPLCEFSGSPFTARLVECFCADFEAGGPVAELVGDWPGHPRADAVAMRLAGALHAAVLTGRDAALAAQYPAQRSDWDMAAVWPLARALFARDQAWVKDFIRSPPQTNEVRRSIALLLGFLTLAHEHSCAFDTFELGASAGLNLGWDRFSYRSASWSWGVAGGVPIDTAWEGPPPPLDATPRLRSRAACDINPLDITDTMQRLQLRSYIWADQRDRLARFDAAADLAAASGTRVERADAAEWLARKLSERAPGAGAIVYHSLFLQYPPRATRVAISAAIEAAGERATPEAPLAWMRLEPEAMLGGPRESVRYMVDLVTWPGAIRRVLAVTDGHVRGVQVVPHVGEPR